MTNDEIRDMFDTNPSLTVRRLARIAGRTEQDVLEVLMQPLSQWEGN